MPQSVLVQVGQCGNQIGFNFWKSLLQEYECHYDKLSENDFCQFLRPKSNIIHASKSFQENYSARGILIDMEERVLDDGLKSSIGSLFLNSQILKDVSGSGNNWAVGHFRYGRKYNDTIQELFRFQAESCDNLEAALFVFSLSGGTGSGLGTYALQVFEDYYPKVCRIACSVFPSDDASHVITSPYNAALCNSKLLQHADIIVPFENMAMNNIFSRLESNKFIKKTLAVGPNKDVRFELWNNLIVATILDCTSVSRYLNFSSKTLRELVLNLAPDKYLKYAVPNISPIHASEDYSIERLFNDVFSDTNSLFDCKNLKKIVCGASVFSRGPKLDSTAVENNVNRLKKTTQFVDWLPAGFQHGECRISPTKTSASVVMLTNTSAISHYFFVLRSWLQRMYGKKFWLHHYYNEDADIENEIENADEKLLLIIQNYEELKTYALWPATAWFSTIFCLND